MSQLPSALQENRGNTINGVKMDSQFLIRKIRRLEGDISLHQEEISKLRLRNRRLEDFEMKVEVLGKENRLLDEELRKADAQKASLIIQLEKTTLEARSKGNVEDDWQQKISNLQQEVDKWKQKTENAEQKTAQAEINHAQRAQLTIKRQATALKNEFAQKQEDYEYQVRQLKRVIHEKQTVENVIKSRVDKIRAEKDEQINRLLATIQKEKQSRLAELAEKDNDIERLKQKFEKLLNFEVENLKQNLEEQDEVFSIEINGLREMIGVKNDEITKLLVQMKRMSNESVMERQGYQTQISMLKQKLFTLEREDEQQLYNLRERLLAIHGADIKALTDRCESRINSLVDEKAETERYLKEKERMTDSQRKDYARLEAQFQDRLKDRDNRIAQLEDRIKSMNSTNAEEMKNLHQSLHKIESDKEKTSTDYQQNITFMQQQIAKLTASNELKTIELKKTLEENFRIQQVSAEQLKEAQARLKKQRIQKQGEYEEKKEHYERTIQEAYEKDKLRDNEEKRLNREKEKLTREKIKLEGIIQQMEKDIGRLNSYIKKMDDSLKDEFKKNQISMLDVGGARRELMADFDKQKVEFEALKRLEVDQVTRKFELENGRLNSKCEKLQTELLQKSLAYENLDAEFKKLSFMNKNFEKIQNDKASEYETKMATLQQEINLTKTLYETFQQAKARKSQK